MAVLQNNTNDYPIADCGTTGHFLQMDSVCRDKNELVTEYAYNYQMSLV